MFTPRNLLDALPRDYWHVKEPMGQHFAPQEVRGYYIDMREKAGAYSGPTKDGFPLRNQNGEGLQLLPVTVTQMALGHFDFWLENQERKHLNRFIDCADWLVENHQSCPNKKDGWLYHFDHGRLGIKAPFISAMGQGQGISVLTRAHQVTQDEKYLSIADRALEPFDFEVSEGGVTARTKDGDVYFEEYPCEPYSHILNGHIFALWGLYDYSIYRQNEHAKRLFVLGTETLRNFLPRYDVGFWSRYGLFPHPMPNVATPIYHELHIAQLRVMFELTDIQEFSDYADRWEQQLESWLYFFKAVYGKVRFKMWVKARKRYRSKTRFPVKD